MEWRQFDKIDLNLKIWRRDSNMSPTVLVVLPHLVWCNKYVNEIAVMVLYCTLNMSIEEAQYLLLNCALEADNVGDVNHIIILGQCSQPFLKQQQIHTNNKIVY